MCCEQARVLRHVWQLLVSSMIAAVRPYKGGLEIQVLSCAVDGSDIRAYSVETERFVDISRARRSVRKLQVTSWVRQFGAPW